MFEIKQNEGSKTLFKYKYSMKGTVTVQLQRQSITPTWIKRILIESPYNTLPTYSTPGQRWRYDEWGDEKHLVVVLTNTARSSQGHLRLTESTSTNPEHYEDNRTLKMHHLS
jgi:hypothetical protein